LAEEYAQGKCTREDLKPKKKELFKSLVSLAKGSPPTSTLAAAKKRPAAAARPAAQPVPLAKKPAGAAARLAAQPVPVARKPAAAAARPAAASAAAAAARTATRTTSARMSQLVPAAALRGTAMEADSAQLGEEEEEEEEEESEEAVPYVQLYTFSQGGSCCMCVIIG
jgi:hypothetical protein